MIFNTELLQMGLHPIWENTFFYLFVMISILFFTSTIFIMNILRKKTKNLKYLQQQYIAKIDNIRKEHTDKLENLRIEMLRREEERSRQWMESEKETLHVLNGVSNLLDLTDKIGRVDSEKILSKLNEIQEKVEKLKSE